MRLELANITTITSLHTTSSRFSSKEYFSMLISCIFLQIVKVLQPLRILSHDFFLRVLSGSQQGFPLGKTVFTYVRMYEFPFTRFHISVFSYYFGITSFSTKTLYLMTKIILQIFLNCLSIFFLTRRYQMSRHIITYNGINSIKKSL